MLSLSSNMNTEYLAAMAVVEAYVEEPEVLESRAYFHDIIKPNLYVVCNGKSAFAQKLTTQGYIPLVTATVKALEANPTITDMALEVELIKQIGQKDFDMFAAKHK